MIIDADCHISPERDELAITAGDLLRIMDDCGVDRALCWLKPPYTRHLSEHNRAVHEAQQAHPDRIIGFGWANPRLGVREAIEETRRCLEDYGFPGVKLNGAQDGYFIDDERLSLPVIKRIAEAGAVLAFHVGADAPEKTHPFRVAKIAARFPDTPILMAHMGGVGVPHLHAAAIEFAERHRNLHLIGSAAKSKSILRAIERLGPERVSFGSDAPFGLMHVELARYRALLRDLDEDARALVLGGSIAGVLGV
ncbi:MAG: amidohydrolase family protein [Candidatus Brocadiia bacterium]